MSTETKIDLAAIGRQFDLPLTADGKALKAPHGRFVPWGTNRLAFVTSEPEFPVWRLRKLGTVEYVKAYGCTLSFSVSKLPKVLAVLAAIESNADFHVERR